LLSPPKVDHSTSKKIKSFPTRQLARAHSLISHNRRLSFLRERRKKKSKAEIVDDLIQKVENKLSVEDVKASLGDYIRLVQLQKELEDEEPREITVTWVEPEEADRKGGLDGEE
jgi:hypothetical protein